MGGKPRTKARFTDCLCCGDRIGCREHTHCQQLCSVGLCFDCANGDCFDENIDDIADAMEQERQRHEETMQQLNERYNALEAAGKRAAQWRKERA